MTGGHKIKLNKMIGFPAAAEDDKLVYRSAEKAEAMETLKEALSRPADDPRRMGDMQDALYTLTHGDNAMSENEVQKEIDAFLAVREKEAQNRAKKLAETFAEMTNKTQNAPTPQNIQQNNSIKKRRGPDLFY